MRYHLNFVYNIELYDQDAKRFDNVVREFGIEDELYFPNYSKAPWHVQWRPDDDTEVNFWPHKCKGHVAYTEGRAAQGPLELMILIGSVLDDEEDEDLTE